MYSIDPEIFGRVVSPVTNKGSSEKSAVTLENFSEYLKKNSIIKSLPKGSSLIISVNDNGKIYNYLIKDKAVSYIDDQNEKPDIEISFPSKYISRLNEADLCEIAKEMNSKGDLSFKSNIDKVSLLWKYRAFLKYKSCLGY